MELRKMKALYKVAGLIAIIICFSCEGDILTVDCNNCVEKEPDNALVKIKLRTTSAPVILRIYEGNLEDGILNSTYETNGPDYSVTTGLNKMYTFTATYNIDSKTYIAVSSTIPRVKYDKTQCDNPCYFIYDNVVDLRLKYTAK